MNTRSIIFAIAAVCALAAVSNAHTDEAIESYAEATEFVSSFEKSDKGDSACTKVADDAVNAIKTECSSQQKVVNTAAKANKACCTNGRKAVCRSKMDLAAAQLKVNKCNKELNVLQQKKITFPSISLSSLNGKCGSFYNAQVYKNARRKADQKKTECTKLTGALKDSKKVLRREVKAAALSRTTCSATYKRRLATAFRAAKKVCSSKANAKAFLRAAHMKCVLKGTKISKCKVGKAPKVINTKQRALTCAAITEKTICQAGPMKLIYNPSYGCTYESQAGMYADPGHCGNKIALYGMKNGGANSQYWKSLRLSPDAFSCPPGWKWGTGKEYEASTSGHCRNNNGSSRQKDPWRSATQAFYGRCHSCTAYNCGAAGGSTYAVYFMFSDSWKTGWYQHAGNQLGYINKGGFNYKSTSLAHMAGLACIRK